MAAVSVKIYDMFWSEMGSGSERIGEKDSGRKNVLSMRELFFPDPLAEFEKMAGFQIFYCLKIRCFHS